MKRLVAAATLLAIIPALASAQSSAQSKDHPSRGQGYLFFGLGPGAREDWGPSIAPRPTRQVIKHVGFGGEGFLYEGLGAGGEIGYVYRGGLIASGDMSYHFRRSAKRGGVDPFVLAGGTWYFTAAEGSGLGRLGGNFGGGVNIWQTERAALRLEVRDHVCGSYECSPGHYVSFRVGITFR